MQEFEKSFKKTQRLIFYWLARGYAQTSFSNGVFSNIFYFLSL